MYHKGELEIGETWDLRDDANDVSGAFLPHSCEKWVIGGPDQIKDLIADLQIALSALSPDAKMEE